MKKIITELIAELRDNSKECERAAVRRAKSKEYNDAIELLHFSKCYKSAARIAEKYLKRGSVAAEEKQRKAE